MVRKIQRLQIEALWETQKDTDTARRQLSHDDDDQNDDDPNRCYSGDAECPSACEGDCDDCDCEETSNYLTSSGTCAFCGANARSVARNKCQCQTGFASNVALPE